MSEGRAPPNSLDTPSNNYCTVLTPRAQFCAPFFYVGEGFFLPGYIATRRPPMDTAHPYSVYAT